MTLKHEGSLATDETVLAHAKMKHGFGNLHLCASVPSVAPRCSFEFEARSSQNFELSTRTLNSRAKCLASFRKLPSCLISIPTVGPRFRWLRMVECLRLSLRLCIAQCTL